MIQSPPSHIEDNIIDTLRPVDIVIKVSHSDFEVKDFKQVRSSLKNIPKVQEKTHIEQITFKNNCNGNKAKPGQCLSSMEFDDVYIETWVGGNDKLKSGDGGYRKAGEGDPIIIEAKTSVTKSGVTLELGEFF